MFKQIEMQKTDDFFTRLSERQTKGVFFYRINGYSGETEQFIRSYYKAAGKNGVILEGKLPNPDERNLEYYNEIMGMDFQFRLEFITDGLKKWLPRMNDTQRGNVAASLYDSLSALQKQGKTEHMLKNAYIKCMCWLYYRFERIVNRLGEDQLPKILYEGEISSYEFMMLTVLSKAGCDIVLLQYQGDAACLKKDAGTGICRELKLPGMQPFQETEDGKAFSLKKIRNDLKKEAQRERMYGTPPQLLNCTNAWTEGTGLSDIRKSVPSRGTDPKLFYNCFIRMNGVQDKLTYANELYQFQLELKNSGRRVVIVDDVIERPSAEEIARIQRKNNENPVQMLMDLASNIRFPASTQLQRLMVKAFADVLLPQADLVLENTGQGERAKADAGRQNISGRNRLMNRAVYLLCWLRRYQDGLFQNWKAPEISCFIYMGGCRDENEALFLRFLARLPTDVLILCPQPNRRCCLSDRLLYEISYETFLDLRTFPRENADVHIGTAAYHAERELDTLMYQDSGMYRNQQYDKANAVILQTMYEEIKILWKEEIKYRPNFATIDGVVTLPVIFAKVSGVPDGLVPEYWRFVKELVTEDTFVIKNAPFIGPGAANPVKAHVTEFLKNGRILKAKVKNHSSYQYGFLREEMQDYILDKLQLLLDQKLICGTFENGTEYTAAATVLNLPKEIVRLLQKFDFTKTNPKLLFINTGEAMISLEDTILTAFLHLAGFDVVFFVPTGYQNIEKYFNRKIMEEHQAGEYLYDLQIPKLERPPSHGRSVWRDIFKRGR